MADKEITRKVDTGIIKRGKSYRFTVYMGYGSNGKQIRKTCTFKPPAGLTQRRADQMAKQEYMDFSRRCRGICSLQENMRFKELVEEYKRLYAPNKLKPVTAYNYEHHINCHLIGYFGNKKLKDVTPALINDFFALRQNLSYGNARRIYCILQSLFTFAAAQGYIKETPCRNVILPGKKDMEEEGRNYLLYDELPEFLALFRGYSSFNTMILMLLFTGMRTSECLGLQWEDIDFENRKIYIRHTLSNVGGRVFLTSPKTKNSVRYQFMGHALYELLREHKMKQDKLRETAGDSFGHPEMVFTSRTGNFKDRSSLYVSFKRKLKGTAFEFMTLHKLRHTNATLLLNSGTDLKVVSEHLGHSRIAVTADVYASVLDDTRRKTSCVIGQIIGGQTPDENS